jgi:hypothetical protein
MSEQVHAKRDTMDKVRKNAASHWRSPGWKIPHCPTSFLIAGLNRSKNPFFALREGRVNDFQPGGKHKGADSNQNAYKGEP